MKYVALIGALTLCCAARGEVSAQSGCTSVFPLSCSTGNTALRINITVGRAVHLAIAPSATALTAPTAADYDAGFANTNGPTLTMRTNSPWNVAISAGAANWTAVDAGTEPAWTAKPAADLLWSTALSGPYNPMTTTPVTISTGVATAGTPITLYFRTLYNWITDSPGNYSLQLVFTITAP